MSTLAWLLREVRRELGPEWPILVFLGGCAIVALYGGIIWAVDVIAFLMGAP